MCPMKTFPTSLTGCGLQQVRKGLDETSWCKKGKQKLTIRMLKGRLLSWQEPDHNKLRKLNTVFHFLQWHVQVHSQEIKWTDIQTGEIDRKATGLCSKTSPRACGVNKSVKDDENWLNVDLQKKGIHGNVTGTLCPCCSLEDEDKNHMFRCQSKHARTAIELGLATMENTLKKDTLPPAVHTEVFHKQSKASPSL